MKIHAKAHSSGIALIIVLLVIVVLGLLAGEFAYLMKVEITLARKASFDPEMEWIGRSGVEYAAYILGQGSVGIAASYDALNQKWAGGTGDTNTALAELPMENVPLGNGRFSLKIIDLDRKFNINLAVGNPIILQGALMKVVGPGGQDVSPIVDAIQDWRDPDRDTHMNGAEGADYRSNPNAGFPPYNAKDGLIDDITELLLIRGVTPAMFWGNSGSGYSTALPQSALPASQSRFQEPVYMVGLADLFTPLSGRLVNINTASIDALQVLLEIDENVAQAIRMARAGPDGAEGNEDDTPFRSPQEIGRVPGIPPPLAQQLARFFTVRSLVFETHVQVEVGGNRREYVATLLRRNPRDVQVLSFYWR